MPVRLMVIDYAKLSVSLSRKLLLALTLLILLSVVPGRADAQWPPFKFALEPHPQGRQITYRLSLSKQVDWPMTDVLIKIPLPPGVRFLEAGANPATSVNFDGAELTFFTASFHKSIKDAFFTVEVIDPTTTLVGAHAWLSWKGEQPGDYLTDEILADLTKKPLLWQKPESRLQLETTVLVEDSVITYSFYPLNRGRLRMWDLRVNVPLPAGTNFLAASAPPPFTAGFDGREISFALTELAQDVDAGPLQVKVAIDDSTAPLITTFAWASWKNVGKRVGLDILAQESYQTGPINVTPLVTQQSVVDITGDVPFASYDLTDLTLQREDEALNVIFHTVGPVGPVGEPLEFTFYVDQDCRADTGLARTGRGVEVRLRYRHSNARLDTHTWDSAGQIWERLREPDAAESVTVVDNRVTIRLPQTLVDSPQFCWLGEARYRTEEYIPSPPTERLPDSRESNLAQFDQDIFE